MGYTQTGPTVTDQTQPTNSNRPTSDQPKHGGHPRATDPQQPTHNNQLTATNSQQSIHRNRPTATIQQLIIHRDRFTATKRQRRDLYAEKHTLKEPYIWKGHTHEQTYTRTHEKICTHKRHAHEGDVHTREHKHRGTYIRGTST